MMKVSEQQLLILIQTLRDSLKIADDGHIFTYPTEIRIKIMTDFLNQQDIIPHEIEE